MANTRDLWIFLRARDEASRVVRGFAQSVRTSAMTVKAAQLDAQAQQLRQRASLARYFGLSQSYVRSLNDQATGLHNQANALRISAAQARDHDKALSNMIGRIAAVGQTLFIVGAAFAAFGIAGAIALKKTIDVAVEYERQVRHTVTQIDKFAGKLRDIGDIGLRVARDIAVPFEQIQPALFDIFSSMEIGVKDAEVLLKAFSKGAVAGQTQIQSVSRATIGLLNTFQLPAKEVNRLLDIQFQLIQEGVGTYDEWNERIGLVTPSAVRAGQSIEIMMAALAAATRMGLSAARAGTSVARAFDALSHPKTVNKLKQFGVNALTAAGKMRPMDQILKDLRTQLLKLPEPKRLEMIIDIFKGAGGTIEARRFLQNMLLVGGNIEMFQGILGEMRDDSGAFEKAYRTMADSVAAKSQILSNRWKILQESIGKALIPSFTKLVDWLSKIVDKFNSLPDSTKKTITTILLIGTAVSIVIGVILVLAAAIAGLVLAFAVAGPAILATFAIIGGGVLVLAGAVVAMVKMIQGSDKLRASFENLRNKVGETWDALKGSFEKVVGYWQKNVKPAADEIIKKIGDDLGKAVDSIAKLLEKTLIPTLKGLTDWYHENKKEVDQVVSALVTLSKVVGELVSTFLGPFILIIGGAAIMALVSFIEMVKFVVVEVGLAIRFLKVVLSELKKYWNTVWGGIKAIFVSVWSAIVSFFKNVWEEIKNFVSATWQAILGILKGALGIISAIWEGYWSVFGGLIKAVWEFIVAVIELAFVSIELVISVGLGIIKGVWNKVWGDVKAAAETVWNVIFGFLKFIWDNIVKFFSLVWDGILVVWNAIWDKIGGKVKGTSNSIKDDIVRAWTTVKDKTVEIWNGVFNSVSEFMGKAKDKVIDILKGIRDFFLGVSSWFREAGANIVQSIIDGITSKFKQATDKVKELTQKIKDLLPHSPAKRGPLSGRGSPFHSGQAISTMLAEGIRSKAKLVELATIQIGKQFGVLGSIQSFVQSNPLNMPPVGIGSVEPTSKTINNTFNIKTQEIDPRLHATQLGWELQARM